MAEDTVVCPKCGTEIPITKALKESIESKVMKEYDEKIEEDVQNKLKTEGERIRQRVYEEFDSKYRELTDSIQIKEKHLQEAQKRESDERKRRLELEESYREQKLNLERQMEEEKTRLNTNLRKEYDEEFNLRNREIQQNNEMLMRQVQELRQKLEQGSQQLQGEVLEEELEEQLRSAFASDSIIPIPQGTRGPDVVQTVRTLGGVDSGIIAWEAKRTKEWNEEWVAKLKVDVVKYKAEMGVIVSKALPKGMRSFGMKEGVLVTNFENAIPLAVLVRMNLMEIARQKRLGDNSTESRDILYRYLTSVQFRQRVEAVADGIIRMRNDVEAERRAMERQWAKRVKEIEKAVGSISGMFGDLQGIIGPSLPSVKSLSLPEGTDEDQEEK